MRRGSVRTFEHARVAGRLWAEAEALRARPEDRPGRSEWICSWEELLAWIDPRASDAVAFAVARAAYERWNELAGAECLAWVTDTDEAEVEVRAR
jgi:hypothetical protein